MKLASPINIWSGSSEMNGLGAALTNPTELSFKKGKIKHHYPVVFNNQQYPDAEAAYQAYKTGYIEPDKQIMTAVIKAKLEQHPQLLSAITFRGGVARTAKLAAILLEFKIAVGKVLVATVTL